MLIKQFEKNYKAIIFRSYWTPVDFLYYWGPFWFEGFIIKTVPNNEKSLPKTEYSCRIFLTKGSIFLFLILIALSLIHPIIYKKKLRNTYITIFLEAFERR